MELDLLRNHGFHEPRHFANRPGKLEALHLEPALAGVVEHLLRELGGSPRCDLDLVEARSELAIAADEPRGQRRVARDREEQGGAVVRIATSGNGKAVTFTRVD